MRILAYRNHKSNVLEKKNIILKFVDCGNIIRVYSLDKIALRSQSGSREFGNCFC